MIGNNKSLQLLPKPVNTGRVRMYWTLGLGHRSTDVSCPGSLPQPYSDLGPDYSSDLPYDLGPEIYTRLVNISYKYCLRTLVYLGGIIQPSA